MPHNPPQDTAIKPRRLSIRKMMGWKKCSTFSKNKYVMNGKQNKKSHAIIVPAGKFEPSPISTSKILFAVISQYTSGIWMPNKTRRVHGLSFIACICPKRSYPNLISSVMACCVLLSYLDRLAKLESKKTTADFEWEIAEQDIEEFPIVLKFLRLFSTPSPCFPLQSSRTV